MDNLTRYPPSGQSLAAPRDRDSLADVLERVLDKGLVIAGDVQINLLDIELLTIKLRLLIASADKAREMGIDWWQHDPQLSSKAKRELPDADGWEKQNRQLRERIEQLESQLGKLMRDDRSDDEVPAPPARAKGDRAHGPARR